MPRGLQARNGTLEIYFAMIYVNHRDWEMNDLMLGYPNKHGGFHSSCCVLLRLGNGWVLWDHLSHSNGKVKRLYICEIILYLASSDHPPMNWWRTGLSNLMGKLCCSYPTNQQHLGKAAACGGIA